MKSFVALYDIHWGMERKNRKKVPLHDPKAVQIALDFCRDFKPDHVILGGDILDCGAISHHNRHKPGAVEGLRLLADAKELRKEVLDPIEKLKPETLTYITGNHEDWLDDLTVSIPGLEGITDLRSILQLDDRWKVVPQGEYHKIGKLVFIHGDQISGGEHCAKNATVAYERNIRFGHFHTFQAYTKTSAVDMHGHTGIAVPCLCRKNPAYGQNAPNRWMQGFLWGFIDEKNGEFNDYVTIITHSRATILGKTYGKG